MYSLDEVKKVDPEVAQAIIDEENRQNSHIVMALFYGQTVRHFTLYLRRLLLT